MAWTTPKTDWATGNLVAASNLNDIGNNLAFLKAPPTAQFVANQGSDYTTTSTSFVDVDATNMALTINTAGGDVLVGFFGTFYTLGGSGSNFVFLDVLVDGARIAGDDGLLQAACLANVAGGVARAASFVRLITGLSAGSHTFKLQWKVSQSAQGLYAGAGTSTGDVHPQFWVREVS